MKVLFLFFVCCFCMRAAAQETEAVGWLNTHAREIAYANPEAPLGAFERQVPERFMRARIFGFGEATHHGKEFFWAKAQFFKYLVLQHGVRAFVMEESFTAEESINAWLSGGAGTGAAVMGYFSLAPWQCQEVLDLLVWMRAYNAGKPQAAQIRFYGMDMQHVQGIDKRIRRWVAAQGLAIDEKLLSVLDSSCRQSIADWSVGADAGKWLPALRSLADILEAQGASREAGALAETQAVMRAMRCLIQYAEYRQRPQSTVRDSAMFENVRQIVAQAPEGKAFIWAHNEHINHKEFIYDGSNLPNLGKRLKMLYQDDYYSVGFDFGGGELPGYVTGRSGGGWQYYRVARPFKRTYAATLQAVQWPMYFTDMHEALAGEAAAFFRAKHKQLLLGGPGYDPRKKGRMLIDKRYADMYDGLIFIGTISPPDYDLTE